jgi:hypothetical protein
MELPSPCGKKAMANAEEGAHDALRAAPRRRLRKVGAHDHPFPT